eukprot:m51a1_g12380 putative muts protein homolog 4 (791) ;mRNA; r:619892-622759
MESEEGREGAGAVVAVAEGKARQVGVAALECRAPRLHLSQLFDGSAFCATAAKIHASSPSTILISENSLGSDLSRSLSQRFSDVCAVVSLPRSHFSETHGTPPPRAPPTAAIEGDTMFLCLAAACAALRYAEATGCAAVAPGSLVVSFAGSEGRITIDCSTASKLELVQNVEGRRDHTLFSAVNKTKTAAGDSTPARMLVNNLMEPLADVATIVARQDAVDELLSSEQLYFSVVEALEKAPDVDRVATVLSKFAAADREGPQEQPPRQRRPVCLTDSAQQRAARLAAKTAIEAMRSLAKLPRAAAALAGARSPLLAAVRAALDDAAFDRARASIAGVVCDEAAATPAQLPFAVRPGVEPFLDVARKALAESAEDIHSAAKGFAPDWRLRRTAKRGYFLERDRPCDALLPPCFIDVEEKGGKVSATTAELSALSERNSESLSRVMVFTAKAIRGALAEAADVASRLARAGEALALLDVLQSFAAHAILAPGPQVRPEVLADGPIAIKRGRHPILDGADSPPRPVVPNDTFVGEGARLHVITGANMSGKSTYIRQVALLCVLAHVGARVPAEFASFRLCSRILSCMGPSAAESAAAASSSSSMMLEMREVAAAAQSVDDRSLCLFDELGRTTSHRDGMSLAWAVCERLALRSAAYCLFVTHYRELARLSALYPHAVFNYHFPRSATFVISDGPAPRDSRAGVEVADSAGMPREIVELALAVREELWAGVDAAEQQRERERRAAGSREAQRGGVVALAQRLRSLRGSTLDDESLRRYLAQLRQGFASAIASVQ